ncbi:MAG: hypothetical protein KC547_12170 [Anaerolineae bacterium]|nr:hypothetical protein [Anaerolineae bacterium]
MSSEKPLLVAEFMFMHQKRSVAKRERAIFDDNLRARLGALTAQDSVLFICNSDTTRDSLQPLAADFPQLTIQYVVTNPEPNPQPRQIPFDCQWEMPAAWQQMTMSDRWARILCALDTAAKQASSGYLVMPAQDAAYSRELLLRLIDTSQAEAVPCAISPRTRLAQASQPGTSAAQIEIADLHNAAFDRAALEAICETGGQGFWGKLGLIPFVLCKPLLAQVETHTWEDDLEIDRVLADLGCVARCVEIDDPALFRLVPPVFDRAQVHAIIERHLHYSLKIPGEKQSALWSAPSSRSQLRAQSEPTYALRLAEAENMIADCERDMHARVARYGASWVDWGGYRYVARPRDPVVEVWKLGHLV